MEGHWVTKVFILLTASSCLPVQSLQVRVGGSDGIHCLELFYNKNQDRIRITANLIPFTQQKLSQKDLIRIFGSTENG